MTTTHIEIEMRKRLQCLNGGGLRLLTEAALAIAILLGLSSIGFAAPGDLDVTFGNGGKVTTSFGSSAALGSDLTTQPDGKIIVVGCAGCDQGIVALARYNLNGTLDSTFGVGGKVTTVVSDFWGNAIDVVLQSDGKIVVAGQSSSFTAPSVVLVVRYNQNGSLDSSFGIGGIVRTSAGEGGGGTSLLIQPNGKIIVGGFAYLDGNNFFLARYNTNGSLDSTFGFGGRVITSIGNNTSDICHDVLLQPDGKIIAIGESVHMTTNSFALVRYNPDGTLDPTFGGGGAVTTSFTDNDSAATGLLESDGRIIAAGSSSYRFALTRYNSNGSLDLSYGLNGLAVTEINDAANVASVALQVDGKVVAAGSAYETGQSTRDFALARYDSTGSLDNTFGSGGVVTTAFGINTDDRGSGIAIQQFDRKIVVAGTTGSILGGNFAVVRYYGLSFSPTATPTPTPTSTPTSTPTPTATPTTAPTATPTNTPTATPTNTPTATPTPDAGFEADVAPRTLGDGIVLSTDVTQMRRFATGLDTIDPSGNEGQRAECAPRATLGDGVITSADVVQARRYAAGLDPLTPAGGPTVARPAESGIAAFLKYLLPYFWYGGG